MATDTLSGFIFYYGNKTMVLDDGWTFMNNGTDIINTLSTCQFNLSGIISTASGFGTSLSGDTQKVNTMSGNYHTFDTSIRTSVTSLNQHVQSKIVTLSSALKDMHTNAITNLSNNIYSAIQTLSGNINDLNNARNGPSQSAGFSYTALTQTNNALVVNDGYNFNLTDGSVSLEETYTTPTLNSSTTYMNTATYTKSTSIYHTSPSSASFSGTQVLTLSGHGANLITRAFWTIYFFSMYHITNNKKKYSMLIHQHIYKFVHKVEQQEEMEI